jgi:hypothetical protein
MQDRFQSNAVLSKSSTIWGAGRERRRRGRNVIVSLSLDATNRRITKITQKTGQASVAKVLLKRTNRDALQNTALGGLLAT